MARTKQTARRCTEDISELRERIRIRDERRAERKKRSRVRNHIHIKFHNTAIRNYFKPTAHKDTFRRCMEEKIASSIRAKLRELDWEYEGDKRDLLNKLKVALGGRLYSRDLIGMWCEEGLATIQSADD